MKKRTFNTNELYIGIFSVVYEIEDDSNMFELNYSLDYADDIRIIKQVLINN